jgi:hypothetical protein
LKKKGIVSSCERTPCIHGQCYKTNFYTEICVCQQNWTGLDCSQKSMKNLTNNDSNDYLNWLNINYGISKIPNRFHQVVTTQTMSHRFSRNKNQINFFEKLCRFFNRIYTMFKCTMSS